MREGARSLNFKYMAAGLAATIVFEGERGRKAWSEVRANLAEVATAADDDPRTAGQALLKFVKDESTPTAFKMVLKEIVPNLEEIASTANPGVLKGLVCRVADEFKMTPIADSEPIHMVDPDMNFCKENMDRIIRRSAELSAPNAPYAVISIVGVQGIGKSFLLNKLFGTKFPELDVRLGRSRTTRGIMMSRCIGPSLLLLDFEGFDGTEQVQYLGHMRQVHRSKTFRKFWNKSATLLREESVIVYISKKTKSLEKRTLSPNLWKFHVTTSCYC